MIDKDVIFINDKSNIALCTLWSKKEHIFNKIPLDHRNKVNSIGTLYTINGINYVLQTLGERNNIDKIIVYGPDLSYSGEALIDIFSKKDKDTYNKYKLRLKYEDIENILNTVNIIDLRKNFWSNDLDSLLLSIDNNYRENKGIRKKAILSINENVEEIRSWPMQLSGEFIYETSVFAAWVKGLYIINEFGMTKNSDYNEEIKEFLNLMVTIDLHGSSYELEKDFFHYIQEQDFNKHIKGLSIPEVPEGVDYTYGNRLLSYNGNQIESIINKLGRNANSRRALGVTWDPKIDQDSVNPPCIISINGNITDNQYTHTVYIRSNDFFRGWPLNIYGQIYLAKYIVDQINKRYGKNIILKNITTISTSAHVYSHDFEYLKDALDKYGYLIKRFIPDPKGNFTIKTEDGKIILEHRTPDNTSIDLRLKGDFNYIYNMIKGYPFYTLPSHSLYLGKELKKAEESIREGKKYTQDEV